MVQSAKTPHGGVAWPSIPPILSAAASLQASRPGGNTTGFTNFEPSLTGKWLELLKEIAPGIVRVAVIFNPKTAPGEGSFFLGPFEAVARSFAVEPIAARVTDAAQIESALAAIWREPGGGLIVMPDAFTTIHRKAPAVRWGAADPAALPSK
jgi:putative tryptophan/tyrosine transport system substrate-binding protein